MSPPDNFLVKKVLVLRKLQEPMGGLKLTTKSSKPECHQATGKRRVLRGRNALCRETNKQETYFF